MTRILKFHARWRQVDGAIDVHTYITLGYPTSGMVLGLKACSMKGQLHCRAKFGEHAFSHAGPSAWNAHPEDIRATSDSVVFRRLARWRQYSSPN